jgi:hypothetical protein
MKHRFTFLVALLATLMIGTGAAAQARRDARLQVTVIDQSNGILPGATVTVTGTEDATRAASIPMLPADANGIVRFDGLAPGRYSIRAEFPGFDPGLLKEIRLRSGDNRHIVILNIEKHQESVTVGQDSQSSASDRRSGSFGTALTREQMDALSDDPNELQRQLQDMAGPGAVIRVDSFEGGTLPPKAQIKAIHITRDQFAAENHSADGVFIDIITQPGVGPLRTNLNYMGHNTAMTSRNALAPVRGTDQVQNYGIGIAGGLIKDKASFSLAARGASTFDTPALTAVRSDGSRPDAITVRSPRDSRFYNANFDWAVTPDQTLRLSYTQNDFTNRNQGIGGFNEVERAFTNENHVHTFRVQEAGPVGRRFFTNTRLNVGWTDTLQQSAFESVTVRVLDAFTAGGAQVAGGRHSRDLNLASDLDYVRGISSLRVGTAIDGNWFRSDETSNYLGTYTFENLEAYTNRTPRSFVKRIGNPSIAFHNIQAAFYAQDDLRVRRSLTLTLGARYEVQSLMNDSGHIAPRLGISWSPFKNGKTAVRVSWGRFHDWLSTTTYEQTLRVDGFRQQELQVLNPTYPNTSLDLTTVAPVNRYVLGDLDEVNISRASLGFDHGFTQRLHAIVTYRYSRGANLLRGANLNAPVAGVRPDPRFGNIVEVASDGRSRQHQVQLSAQTPPPAPPMGGGPRWDWKRWGFFSTYTFLSSMDDTDGAFSTPATGLLSDDWGPANGSSRHRIQAGFTSSALRNFAWQIDGMAFSGTPYTIRTGFDDNGDLIFNDRPAGVGRNTERSTAQWMLNLFANYTWSFGPRRVVGSGPMIYGTPAGVNVTSFTPPPQARYRLGLIINIQNLTDHPNLIGYSGVLTSQLYGKPTAAINQRRVNVGMQLGF